MKIEIDETVIEEIILAKINQITDDVIKDKIQNLLFNRIDGIFSNYDSIKHMTQQRINENIDAQIPKFTEQDQTKAYQEIATKIAYELKNNIVSAIGYALLPDEPEEEE